MSYAQMAAKGPKQSPEEFSRAHALPSIDHEDSASSIVDVDSPHVSSVKSDYEDQEVKTDTQATRKEHEAEDTARETEQKARETKDKARQKARETEQKVEQQADELKKNIQRAGKETEKAIKKTGQDINDNRENPVVWGNALIWGVGIVAIAAAGYQKHKEGKLDWELAGTVGVAVGAFAVADYFGSKWLLENKYPPK